MNERSKKLMKEYYDRGMIKWQPFAALDGHGDYIKAEAIKRLEIEKPILSSDQREILDNLLTSLVETKNQAMIKYYSKGFIEFEFGIVDSIDRQNKKIIINDNSLSIKDIIEIK